MFCAMTKEIEVKCKRDNKKYKQKQKYKKIYKNAAKLHFVVEKPLRNGVE